MKRRAINGIPGLRPACFAAAAALCAYATVLPAQAQSVVVDLSVLGGGGGYSPSPYAATGPATVAGDGLLLFPPSSSPVSRLEGPLSGQSLAFAPSAPMRSAAPMAAPQSQVTASAPAPTPPAPAPAPAPAAAPAPPPAPAPTETASAPEPAPTPEPPAVTPPPAPPSPAEAPPTAAPPAAAAPPPPPTETAAVPTGDAAGDETRILFDAGSADLNDAAKATLDALAERLRADESLRIQLQAFAAGNDETAPEARRLSLKRALNVRGHLVERDVRNTRMDVRALGIKSGEGPADRVDAVIVSR